MDQFGVHMNFLQIKQVLTFIYTLKIYFYFIFSGFWVFWTMQGFWRKRNWDTGISALDGGSYLRQMQGLFSEIAIAKGYWPNLAVGLRTSDTD
jgi:hypothetical protein